MFRTATHIATDNRKKKLKNDPPNFSPGFAPGCNNLRVHSHCTSAQIKGEIYNYVNM